MARSQSDGWNASAEAAGTTLPDVPAYRDFAEQLRDRIGGDVQFDEYLSLIHI